MLAGCLFAVLLIMCTAAIACSCLRLCLQLLFAFIMAIVSSVEFLVIMLAIVVSAIFIVVAEPVQTCNNINSNDPCIHCRELAYSRVGDDKCPFCLQSDVQTV